VITLETFALVAGTFTLAYLYGLARGRQLERARARERRRLRGIVPPGPR
jgi:hypothetical protein